MSSAIHWTERSPQDFLYSVASNFIEDLQMRMDAIGMSRSQLAERAKVHKSFVSRLFKDPGNLSLETMVKFARCVGLKVSIVAYEDVHDPNNVRGPIDSTVFRWCWEHANYPADMWDVEAIKQTATATVSVSVSNVVNLSTDFEVGMDIIGYSVCNSMPSPTRKPNIKSSSTDIEISNITVVTFQKTRGKLAA